MLRTVLERVTAARVLALVVSVVSAGAISPAFGGGIGVVSIMKSEGPCPYATQLQKSVSERKRFLAKLSEATGGAATGTGSAAGGATGDSSAQSENYFTAALRTNRLTKESRVDIDSFSADCTSCHDGASAIQIQVNWRNNPHGGGYRNPTTSTDHPIGMEYDSYVAAYPRKYKPVTDSRLIFINGRVGCLTCHDPLNSERGHLVKSDRKSALCLTCHNK